jgi:hypothetical protein
VTISPGADDGLVPTAFLATTENRYPEQDEGQVTSMGRVAPAPVEPGGLEVTT